MNPRTGEILAMANEPTFNPNAFRDAQENERRNRAVQDLYEPGSTFKIVTASAALEEKVMDVDALIDTNPGRLVVAGRSRVITDDAGRNNGLLSFTKVIVKSSNIGAVKIGFRVGTERLSRFVGLYGFGSQVSPDFPSENAGIVWSPEKWTESALASVSMGYQIAVTPLQMVAAVSAVANGGQYVEPRVVRAVYRNGVRYQATPKVVRRAVSPDTASALTSIMEEVVTDGTAKRARIDGFSVAGKTGTAQKLIDGQYSHSDHYASFVGFVPSRDPALAIVVVIDSAKGPNGDHGGTVAAPIFKNIAEPALRYLGIPSTINPPRPVLVARGDLSATDSDRRRQPRRTRHQPDRRRTARHGARRPRSQRPRSGQKARHARAERARRRRRHRRVAVARGRARRSTPPPPAVWCFNDRPGSRRRRNTHDLVRAARRPPRPRSHPR